MNRDVGDDLARDAEFGILEPSAHALDDRAASPARECASWIWCRSPVKVSDCQSIDADVA